MDKKWWTLIAVCLGTFMLLLDITIVNVALPAIQGSLRATFSDLQWVVDAYALTLAAMLLTTGSLADLYGRRRLFATGVVLFTAGSLLCGFATGPLFLILSRGAQGIGGAAMFSTSLALLAHAFRGRERGIAFGVWGAITGVAVAVGPVLGGLLTTGISWRWIFFVNAPIGVVAVVLTLLRVEESREQSARRPDWPGFVLFTSALASLVYGLIRASEQSWTDTGVLVCFVLAFVLLVGFVVAERLGNHPMFDLSLFRVPTFVGGLVAAFGISSSIFALLLYLVLYLQDLLGYSALQTGLRLIIISGGILVTSAVAGRLTSKVPIRFLIGPGLLAVGIGLLLMTAVSGTSSWTVLIPGFIVGGLGSGVVNPPLASTAVGVVEPHRAGMASGINSTFRQVGIATGIAALGSLFATRESQELQARLTASVPELAHRSASIAVALRNGNVPQLLRGTTPRLRGPLEAALRESFAKGLDEVLLIGAVVALAAAVASFFLIRQQDFAAGSQAGEAAPRNPGEAAPAAPAPVPRAGAGAGRLLDPAGRPVTEALVSVVDETGAEVASCAPAEDGTFRLPPLPAGSYGLVASSPDRGPEVRPLELPDDAPGEVVLHGRGELTGTVVSLREQRPLPGARVRLSTADGGSHYEAVADESGDFAFPNLREGEYEAAAEHPGYRAELAEISVPPSSAGRAGRLRFALEGAASLQGQVHSTGHPVREARVRLSTPAGQVVASTTTDGSGAYRFEGIEAGDYLLVAEVVEQARVGDGEAPAGTPASGEDGASPR